MASLFALLLVMVSGAPWASEPAATQRSGPVPSDAGAIEGRVILEPLPAPRRQAQRYPGGAPGAPHVIQQLPAVVYLVGALPGFESGSPSMTQRDTTFVPAVVFVPEGGSVAFPNQDPFQHNVYSYSRAKDFDLGRQNPGTSASETFDEPGIVEVFCEVHEFMRGAIVVTQNPYYAIVGVDGSYRIEGVPEGEHTVAFWHPDHDPVELAVVVTSGGTTVLDVEMHR